MMTSEQRQKYSERGLRVMEAAKLRGFGYSDDTVVAIIDLITILQEQAFEEGRANGLIDGVNRMADAAVSALNAASVAVPLAAVDPAETA